MKRFLSTLFIGLTLSASCWAADIRMEVDTALTEVPVNKAALVDDGDFKSIEGAVAYNASGMALRWHFVTTAGAYTVTSVTPTTGGDYDWTDQGDSGVYTIEIPASGGASINNDTEGVGWFTGVATGVYPWTGPTIEFTKANIVNSLVNGSAKLMVDVDTIKTNPVVNGGTVTFPTGATLASAAQATAIEADTQDIQSRLPASLTSQGFMKTDGFIAELTVTSVPSQQTPICSAGTTTANDVRNGCLAIITDVTNGDTWTGDVTDWDAAGGQLTLATTPPFTIAAGDKIILRATSFKVAKALPDNHAPGASGGVLIAGNNAATTMASLALTSGLVGDHIGNQTGNVSGSVGSVTAGVSLANDAITASKYDETTAFPLASVDSGDSTVLRKGSSSITGTSLDTAISGISGAYVSQSGTAQAGAAGTITLASGASSVNDYYNYQIVTLTGGTGAGQARIASDYVGSTKVLSVNGNWATNPDNTTTYTVTAFGQIPGATAPTVSEITADLDANSTKFAAIIADTEDIQSTLAGAPEIALNVDGQVELAPDQSQVTAIGGVNTSGASVRAVDDSGNAIASASALSAVATNASTAATQATTAATQATTAATQSTTAATQSTTAATQSTTAATQASGANTKAADIQGRLPTALVGGKMDSNAEVTISEEDIGNIVDGTVEAIGEGLISVEDIWAFALSSETTAGTASKILADAASRVGTALPNAAPGTGSGVATATNVADVDVDLTPVQTVVDAIKTKTDNLPVDPADASVIAGLIGSPAVTLAADILSSRTSVETKIDNIEIEAAGMLTDVEQDPVGAEQLFIATRKAGGLVGDKDRTIGVGTSPLVGVDFRNVAPAGRQIINVDDWEIVSGTAGGVTFGDVGRDKQTAKCQVTGVTPGTYRVKCRVTFYGGAIDTCVITLKVAAL